ncbi:hypothetical protein DPM33_27430 [Mesorhizobium hawassense]|uniref:Uncharacterized protein n=2 Tax=Mesorhizobium hawassense TaxID=1209954 RepID=A0A330HQW5_9HYPH|nr:hypothetical protein DPM33_27430 [Mesorhizobium hawassense]
MAARLREAGVDVELRPLFDEQQKDALDTSDAAGRIIDFVMIAGSLSCPIPVNLLIRAVTERVPAANISLIGDMFGSLDLFRWRWADTEQSELLVSPRLALEAELICRRRLGDPQREAERLVELIGAVRNGWVDAEHERRFLFNLLQQIGADGPRGSRYKLSYVDIGRALTELRQRFGVVHPSLMLQESAFRRMAVREDVVDQVSRLSLLEEARDAIQTALDGMANGTISGTRRTRQNLLVERASLYGFLANDRARRNSAPTEIWSSYQAARTAIRQAASATDTYFPLDIGLWTPADLLRLAPLAASQRAELMADIYSTLDLVDQVICLLARSRNLIHARLLLHNNSMTKSYLRARMRSLSVLALQLDSI